MQSAFMNIVSEDLRSARTAGRVLRQLLFTPFVFCGSETAVKIKRPCRCFKSIALFNGCQNRRNWPTELVGLLKYSCDSGKLLKCCRLEPSHDLFRLPHRHEIRMLGGRFDKK